MDDGVDSMLRDQRCYARLVPDLADDKRYILRHSPFETGRQIVEHHHALAGIDERVDHMASDIAGTAGDQDRHPMSSLACCAMTVRWIRPARAKPLAPSAGREI